MRPLDVQTTNFYPPLPFPSPVCVLPLMRMRILVVVFPTFSNEIDLFKCSLTRARPFSCVVYNLESRSQFRSSLLHHYAVRGLLSNDQVDMFIGTAIHHEQFFFSSSSFKPKWAETTRAKTRYLLKTVGQISSLDDRFTSRPTKRTADMSNGSWWRRIQLVV